MKELSPKIQEKAAHIALEYRYTVEEFLTEWAELEEPGSPTQQDYEHWHLAGAKSFFHDVRGSLEGEIKLKGLTEDKQMGQNLRAVIRESLARELGQRIDLEELADVVAADIAASWDWDRIQYAIWVKDDPSKYLPDQKELPQDLESFKEGWNAHCAKVWHTLNT